MLEEREGRPITPWPTASDLDLDQEELHDFISQYQDRTADELEDAYDYLRHRDNGESRSELRVAQENHDAALMQGREHHLALLDAYEDALDDPASSRYDAALNRASSVPLASHRSR